MLTNRIDKWFSSAKRFLFRYKDGFFELPILSNSPETIVQSLSKMPFVKSEPEKKYFGTNNPLLKADILYHELEPGLWYLHSEATYKENIHYRRTNDKKLITDYFLLFLEITRTKSNSKNGILNGISYSSCSWAFLKPHMSSSHCRFKGSQTTSMALYLKTDWVNKNLASNPYLNSFFESKSDLVLVNEQIENAEILEKKLDQCIKEISNFKVDKSEELMKTTQLFLDKFILSFQENNTQDNLLELAHIDRKKIIHAEQLLIDSLNGPFIGIDELSVLVGISPTKLKSNFKLVYGTSIFQYFRKQQLISAKDLLQRKDLTVKQIALNFGYTNASKFTAAYKNHFGELPSDSIPQE